MGFSCSIFKVKNHGENLTLEQYEMIDRFYAFSENDWGQQNFNSAEDYAVNLFEHRNPADLPDIVTINYFQKDFINRKYRKSIFEDVEDWCSTGTYFWDDIKAILGIKDGQAKITKEGAKQVLAYTQKELAEMQFKPVIVTHAFTREEVENRDEWNYHSFICDGIEVVDEDGNERRMDTDNFEYTEVYIPINKYFVQDRFDAFTDLRNAIIAILVETDFDNEDVFIVGGY